MPGRYSELYRRTREALESDAESLLQRPLTPHEQNLFRSCGTLTMLESLGMKIYYAQSAEELTEQLATMTMHSRFMLALKETVDLLEKQLGRPITPAERKAMETLGNTEALWFLKETIFDTPPDQREMALRTLLSNHPSAG